MRISELFYSIQGEGLTAGQPRLFIRTSGCTLRCSFCDTKYHIKSREMNALDRKLLKKHKRWCITGGEPLLHQGELVELIDTYEPEWVEIETNGTIFPDKRTVECVNLFNVSPKEKRFQPKQCNPQPDFLNCEQARGFDAETIVKFVYSDKKSEEFIQKIVRKYKLSPNEVWVMPQGVTAGELKKLRQKVWQFCVRNQFNFSDRFQVEIFGKKKGI
jgi:7-carboxy-7-deazaguanine synthase